MFRKNGVQRYGVNFMFTDFTDRTRLPPNENFYKVSQNLNADKTEDNLTDQTEEKEAKKKRARWVYFENAGIPTDSLPKIENVVSSDNLKEKLDLENLAMKHKNAEYNPRYSSALIMRYRDEGISALILSSGRIICTGAKSEDESLAYTTKIYEKLREDEPFVRVRDLKIINIVASCDIGFPIKLLSLAETQTCFCT